MLELKGKDGLLLAKFKTSIEHGKQTKTALQMYEDWCLELGVEGASRGTFNADDSSWVFTTDSTHNWQGLDFINRFNYSSEAGFGLYNVIPANISSVSAGIPNVNRMFCSNTKPLLFFTYHWANIDEGSFLTQWKGNANGFCIYAKHAHYGGSNSQYYVAIKVNSSGINFYFEKINEGTIPLYANTSDGASWINQYLLATIFEGGVANTLVSLSAQSYIAEGSIILDAGNVAKSTRLIFLKEQPIGTNIKIEISNDGIIWTEKQYGDILGSGKILIKATLSTTDSSITPILVDVSLENTDEPQDKILITTKELNAFNNVEGNLTVKYDALIGNLSGRGGRVDSFEVEFTPTDLMPVPNPGVTEIITVAPEIVADLIEIEYVNRYTEEYLSVAPVEITATLIPIEEINP